MAPWLRVGLALTLLASSVLARADVWIADKSNIYKIDASTAQILLTIASPKTLAMAVNSSDKAVWILSDVILSKRSAQGASLVSVDLASVGLDSATSLALDARDGSVWLAEGGGSLQGQSKSIGHLDLNGVVLQKISSPGGVVGLRVALDQSIWVLGKSSVYHYSKTGSQLAAIDLSPFVSGEPKLLAVDSISAWILIAGEKRVLRVDAAGASSSSVLSPLPYSADSLTSDEAFGTYYALAAGVLYSVPSATGIPAPARDLAALGIQGATVLSFDASSEALFIGHASGAARFARSLSTPLSVATVSAVQAIGTEPLALSSTISILSPIDGAITNRALQELALKLQVSCSGNACGFAPGYYRTYSIDAQLNSVQIPFAATDETGRFAFVPTTRLQEGANVLAVSATDSFGISTGKVVSTFVVDTIPPTFLSLSPQNGTYTNQSTVSVNGRLSEPAVLNIGSDIVPVSADGSFSGNRTLTEGSNGFQLIATDRAGNTTTTALTIVLDTIAPTFSGITPVPDSTLGSANIVIGGSVSEPSTITLDRNGIVGTSDGQAFSFPVSLSSGANDFALTATDRAGNKTSLALRYTLGGSTSITIASPTDGANVTNSTVVVTGTVNSDKAVGVRVNDVPATVVGKQFVAQIDLLTGTNAISATATTADGATATNSITVIVPATSQPEPILSAVAGIAPFTLQVDVPRGYFGALDYDGNGTYDDFFYGGGRGSHTYAVPGIYTVKALIADNVNTYTVTKKILVQDVRDLDKLVRASFNGMLDRLRASDLDGAMQFFTPAAQIQYRPVLEQLAGSLSTVPDQIGTIVDGFMTDQLAEYLLVQNRATGKQGFLIYLQKGPDGVWRIAQL